MECSDRRQVHADALWRLQPAHAPEPDGIKTKIFAGKRQRVNPGELGELLEGLSLGRESTTGPGGPSMSFDKVEFFSEDVKET